MECGKVDSPGDLVSIDIVESSIPGMVPVWKGKPKNKNFVAFDIYVDSYSGFWYINFLKKKDAKEIIKGKHKFERLAKQNGVNMSCYHADNGLFATKR